MGNLQALVGSYSLVGNLMTGIFACLVDLLTGQSNCFFLCPFFELLLLLSSLLDVACLFSFAASRTQC